MIFPFYSARYVKVERDICCNRGKKQRDYTFIKPVLWLLTHQGILLLTIFVLSFIYFINLHKDNTLIVTYTYIYIYIYIYTHTCIDIYTVQND